MRGPFTRLVNTDNQRRNGPTRSNKPLNALLNSTGRNPDTTVAIVDYDYMPAAWGGDIEFWERYRASLTFLDQIPPGELRLPTSNGTN